MQLLEPIPGGNTLHTLRTMDWRQIFENHGTPLEDEDLSSESMPVREDDITVIFLCGKISCRCVLRAIAKFL